MGCFFISLMLVSFAQWLWGPEINLFTDIYSNWNKKMFMSKCKNGSLQSFEFLLLLSLVFLFGVSLRLEIGVSSIKSLDGFNFALVEKRLHFIYQNWNENISVRRILILNIEQLNTEQLNNNNNWNPLKVSQCET